MTDLPATPEALIREHHALSDQLDAMSKQFADHVKPWRERLEKINEQLLALSNEQGWESMKTEAGTAFRSTTMTPKVEDREALVDFAMEHWDQIGGDLLIIRPAVAAIRSWMDASGGHPPPGVSVSYFTKMNVRRA